MTLSYRPALLFSSLTIPNFHSKHRHRQKHPFFIRPESVLFHTCVCIYLQWPTWPTWVYPCSRLFPHSDLPCRHSEKTSCLYFSAWLFVALQLGLPCIRTMTGLGRKGRKGAPLCLIPPLFAAWGRGVVFTVDGLMDWDFSLHFLLLHTLCQQQRGVLCLCAHDGVCSSG